MELLKDMTQAQLFDKAREFLYDKIHAEAVWFVNLHGKGNDVFGIFDGVALWNRMVCFFQITTKNNRWQHEKKVEKFCTSHQCHLPYNSWLLLWDYNQNGFEIRKL